MATPVTELRLLTNVDLDTTYNNTFSKSLFGNITGQTAFFQSKTASGMLFQNLSYQRKESSIKINKSFEQVEPLTYGMFRNGNNLKWYYFFINDIEYVSDNVTKLIIEIDVEQTYLFDYVYGNCFVEREHVNNDAIGNNTQEEGLNCGDLIIQNIETYVAGRFTAIVVAVSELLDGPILRGNYNGVYSSFAYYLFEHNDYLLVGDLIDTYAAAGKSDAIISIYLCPESVIPPFTSGDLLQREIRVTDYFSSPKPVSLDGYTPKNNKLFVYPYCCPVLNNSDGQENVYNYEYFSGSDVEFIIRGVVVNNPEQVAIPINYKGTENFGPIYDNLEEILILKQYPECGWTSDIYKNWLAQNAVSNVVGIGGSVLSLGVGIATANPIAIAGGALAVANSIGSFYEKSIIPNSANGNISTNTMIAYTDKTFRIFHKCLRQEYAVIIDNYFTKYGYKINRLKTPNVLTRSRHNFLKTQETILQGNLPRNALKKLIDNRERGITFWHVDDIGNYTPTNSIL